MITKNKIVLCAVFVLCLGLTVNAQVGIGVATPHKSAQLEIKSNDRGVLLPQIKLKGADDIATINNGNVNSLLVFNTVTAGTDGNKVTPGYYYWIEADKKWVQLLTSNHGPDGQKISTLKKHPTVGGRYTYTDEANNVTDIDVIGDVTSSFGDIINNPLNQQFIKDIILKTEGNVVYNSTDNHFTYVDANGDIQVIDMTKYIESAQTLTTLVDNGDGTITYTDENKTSHIINLLAGPRGPEGAPGTDATITSVEHRITNGKLTTVVNATLSSNSIDLTDAVTAATTHDITTSGNAITSTINGIAKTAFAVNKVEASLSTTDLIINVNDIANTVSLASLASPTVIHQVVVDTDETGNTPIGLPSTPTASTSVKLFINGMRVAGSAIDVNGDLVTYQPAANGGYNLKALDIVTIDYR